LEEKAEHRIASDSVLCARGERKGIYGEKKANTAMMLSWEIVVSGLKDSTAKVASVEISCEKQCATITCPTQAPMASESRNSVDELGARLKAKWIAIEDARNRAKQAREGVSKLLDEMKFVSGDASVVVFGSLARDEFTDESDLDWTLLVDGQANSDHLRTAQAIRKKLAVAGFEEPGRTGVFGNTTFSHGLIHLIGGEDDTNRNTTQRILLLLVWVPEILAREFRKFWHVLLPAARPPLNLGDASAPRAHRDG